MNQLLSIIKLYLDEHNIKSRIIDNEFVYVDILWVPNWDAGKSYHTPAIIITHNEIAIHRSPKTITGIDPTNPKYLQLIAKIVKEALFDISETSVI